ncbi:hypothetical protein K501DRAFT_288147 [Backusella circina FSU 941]|nr:hypothetical protein K501DRAFT_288147 [Backusella circina FSU 941]
MSYNQFPPVSSDAGYTSNNNALLPLCPLDDWLDPTAVDLFNKDILNFLPISPPLTVSSVNSVSPQQQQQQQQPHEDFGSNEAFISLFPEIMNTNAPPPKPVVRRLLAPKPVAIMPKTTTAAASSGATFNHQLKRPFFQEDNKDDMAQKRQKNTDAARRSRLKKVIKMESLEKRVTELEGDNARLTTRVAVLESEKNSLSAKDKTLEDRIKVLEAQLAEAHRALTCKNAYEMKSESKD